MNRQSAVGSRTADSELLPVASATADRGESELPTADDYLMVLAASASFMNSVRVQNVFQPARVAQGVDLDSHCIAAAAHASRVTPAKRAL